MAKRKPELDGLRGIAILMVIYHHWSGFTFSFAPGSLVARATAFSWSGVDLFFVLSGFLIGGILLSKRNSPKYFVPFYVRRAARILPLYVLCLAAFYLTRPLHSSWIHDSALPWYWYATLLQNIKMVAQPSSALWLAPTWSLAVEEQFYLIVPVLIRFFRDRSIPHLIATVIVGSFCLRALLYMMSSHAAEASYVLLPSRADALMMGVAAAWIQQKGMIISRFRLYCLLLPVACSVGLLFWLTPDRHSPAMMIVGYSLIACAYTLILMIAVRGGFTFLRWRLLTSAGVLAYGLYLFHLPVIALTRMSYESITPNLTATLLAAPLLVLLASLSWHYYERPFISWAHRWDYGGAGDEFPESYDSDHAGSRSMESGSSDSQLPATRPGK